MTKKSSLLFKNEDLIILHQTKNDNIKLELEEISDGVFIIKSKLNSLREDGLSKIEAQNKVNRMLESRKRKFTELYKPKVVDNNERQEYLNKLNDKIIEVYKQEQDDYSNILEPLATQKKVNLFDEHINYLNNLKTTLNGKEVAMYKPDSLRSIKEKLTRLFKILFGLKEKEEKLDSQLITKELLNKPDIIKQIIAILKNELELDTIIIVGPNKDKLYFKTDEDWRTSKILVGPRKGMAISFLQFVEDKIEDSELLDDIKKMVKYVQSEDAHNRITKKEDAAFDDINFDLLTEKLNLRLGVTKLNSNYTTTDVEVLLLSFYVYLFPFRQQELCDLKWDCEDENYNSINTKTWKCHIRAHKNDKKGIICVREQYNMPKEFIAILKEYRENKLKDCEWVIPNSKKTVLNPDHGTKIFNKIFDGRKISCQVLRRKLSTAHYKQYGNDFKALYEFSEGMGHSISSHMVDYVKQ